MLTASEQLIKTVSAIHPLPAEALDAFAGIFSSFSVKRKTFITLAGHKEKYLYFITSGVQRMYYTSDEGKESIILFTYPYSFGGVLDAFMLQQPSRYYYESLSASSFLRAGFSDVQKLRERYSDIEVMLSKGLSVALSGVLERLAEVQTLSAEEKLRKLFHRSPHIFQLIPQKYLASYLGMDATNFSKFMNNIRL